MSTISLLLCGLLLWPSIQEDYSEIFESDYPYALQQIREAAPLLQWLSKRYDLPSDELASIAFPELIRYSAFKDFFETQAVQQLYIESGAEYANFSIGKFQMRPSFLAQMEEVAQAYPAIQARHAWVLQREASAKEQRRKRVSQLSSPLGQIKALCVFYELALARYPELAPYPAAKRVRYLAVLYNHGFVEELEELQPWLQRRSFPYGWKHSPEHQHPYSAIAQYFYEQSAKTLFPS